MSRLKKELDVGAPYKIYFNEEYRVVAIAQWLRRCYECSGQPHEWVIACS